MIRSFLVLLLGVILSWPVVGQDNNIAFPANHLCIDDQEKQQLLAQYNELPFATALSHVQSSKDLQFYQGKLDVYLSIKGTYTTFVEIHEGVHCMLTNGAEFKPSIPPETL